LLVQELANGGSLLKEMSSGFMLNTETGRADLRLVLQVGLQKHFRALQLAFLLVPLRVTVPLVLAVSIMPCWAALACSSHLMLQKEWHISMQTELCMVISR
jgi:hypothetical protein